MILVDTNLFVALLNERDKNHTRAYEIFNQLISGEFGGRFTLSEVFSETITLLFRKTKRMDIVSLGWDLIYGSDNVWLQILEITMEDRRQAWEIFQKYTTARRPLSFVDCLLIAIAKHYEIKMIASFDAEFDGILERIC
ncbi:MAG: type II toxin-antitoxin system VapC family toxin [Candidatus Heimdallarchaeota archaeon]|nr:type II toxin-antitoxin system VapC family toxin [Candidatus Heimdallarchaeota archaeon]